MVTVLNNKIVLDDDDEVLPEKIITQGKPWHFACRTATKAG